MKTDEQILDKLVDGLQELAPVVKGLASDTRENTAAVAEIRAEFKSLKEVLTSLTKIVRDGNGQKPLTTKVALLEDALEELMEEVKKTEEDRELEDTLLINRIIAIERPREWLKLTGKVLFWILSASGAAYGAYEALTAVSKMIG